MEDSRRIPQRFFDSFPITAEFSPEVFRLFIFVHVSFLPSLPSSLPSSSSLPPPPIENPLRFFGIPGESICNCLIFSSEFFHRFLMQFFKIPSGNLPHSLITSVCVCVCVCVCVSTTCQCVRCVGCVEEVDRRHTASTTLQCVCQTPMVCTVCQVCQVCRLKRGTRSVFPSVCQVCQVCQVCPIGRIHAIYPSPCQVCTVCTVCKPWRRSNLCLCVCVCV